MKKVKIKKSKDSYGDDCYSVQSISDSRGVIFSNNNYANFRNCESLQVLKNKLTVAFGDNYRILK